MRRRAAVAVYALLAVLSVVVFSAFDANSHSASDTIRPFLITMVPVALVALLATQVLSARDE